MIVKKLTVGSFASNNYLVKCEETKDAVLIDASGDYKSITQQVKESNANLKYILYTHAHLDHIAGDRDLKKNIQLKTFLHKDDKFLVEKFREQLMMFSFPEMENPVIDEYIEDGKEIAVGNLKFKTIHTPGHSPGSVCYLVDNTLFSGDTLFSESVGRTDLPGGSYEELQDSVVNKLFTLDEKIKVYPGHGESTTIGHERQNNPFFGLNSRI